MAGHWESMLNGALHRGIIRMQTRMELAFAEDGSDSETSGMYSSRGSDSESESLGSVLYASSDASRASALYHDLFPLLGEPLSCTWDAIREAVALFRCKHLPRDVIVGIVCDMLLPLAPLSALHLEMHLERFLATFSIKNSVIFFYDRWRLRTDLEILRPAEAPF